MVQTNFSHPFRMCISFAHLYCLIAHLSNLNPHLCVCLTIYGLPQSKTHQWQPTQPSPVHQLFCLWFPFLFGFITLFLVPKELGQDYEELVWELPELARVFPTPFLALPAPPKALQNIGWELPHSFLVILGSYRELPDNFFVVLGRRNEDVKGCFMN